MVIYIFILASTFLGFMFSVTSFVYFDYLCYQLLIFFLFSEVVETVLLLVLCINLLT